MKKRLIREKYFDYVIENQGAPSSLSKFLKASGIKRSKFKEKYDNLCEVESDVWKCALCDTMESLEESIEFARYSSKDRGLAFIYSWFECMDLNKDFFKNCKIIKMSPTASQKPLRKFKKRVNKFVKIIIKNGKSKNEFKDRGVPDKHMAKLFWSLFCMNMSSWKDCGSKKNKRKAKKKSEDWMDAMVEKSMIFFFDSMAPNLFDTFFDMLKHKRSKK